MKEWRMKKGGLLVMCMVLALLASPVFGQVSNRTTNFESIVLESFDDPEAANWVVCGSKFINQGFLVESNYTGCETTGGTDNGAAAAVVRSQLVEAWPEALYRDPPEGETVRSLGINAAFNRRGYNYLEIMPVTENEQGELVENPIPLPGRVQNMDMWVWGSNREYYVEVQLRDYRGIVHTLRMGDIGFRGWQNLRLQIPTYIPQEVAYIPQQQGLELVKLVLWTRPEERVNEFYVYLDNIKVFTDTFEPPFDGERLANPETVQELWNQGGGQ